MQDNSFYWVLDEDLFTIDGLKEAKSIIQEFGDYVCVEGREWAKKARYLKQNQVPIIEFSKGRFTFMDYLCEEFFDSQSPVKADNFASNVWMTHLAQGTGSKWIPILNKSGVYCVLNDIHKTNIRTEDMFVRAVPKYDFPSFLCTYGKHDDPLFVTQIDPSIMCLVNHRKDLDPVEWRFWVVNGEIVSSAPYTQSMNPFIGAKTKFNLTWSEAPEEVVEVASLVARADWQPGSSYTVEVGTSNKVPYVLDITPLNLAHTLNAPIYFILEAVRNDAIRRLVCCG